MRQKIDIAEVEAATKIRAKYLRALENEEFSLLPGNTFVKTFLRTYAEYLGLDPQLLLEEYRAGYEPRAEGELQPYSVAARNRRSREPRPPRRAPSGPPGPGTAVAVLVVAVLVIFAILGLTGGDDDGTSNDEAKKETTARDEGKGREERRERPRATTVRLRAVPQVATYLCVDRGPGTDPLYEGTSSEPQRFRGRRRLRINAGNASVRLRVNGKRLRVRDEGQPIGFDFVLHSDGSVSTKALLSGQRPCA
jgi:cytoskeleton protein RodZ